MTQPPDEGISEVRTKGTTTRRLTLVIAAALVLALVVSAVAVAWPRERGTDVATRRVDRLTNTTLGMITTTTQTQRTNVVTVGTTTTSAPAVVAPSGGSRTTSTTRRNRTPGRSSSTTTTTAAAVVAPPSTTSTTRPPPAPPTLGSFSARLSGDRQITASWEARGNGLGATCRLYLDSVERWSGPCNGATERSVGGLSYSRDYAVRVSVSTSSGTASSGTVNVRTNNPPPTPPTVTISKGGSAQGKTGCSSSACRDIVVSLSNFGGGSHTVVCRAQYEEGGFYTYTTSSTTSAVCYYGYPGRRVWVTVDGVQSNAIIW